MESGVSEPDARWQWLENGFQCRIQVMPGWNRLNMALFHRRRHPQVLTKWKLDFGKHRGKTFEWVKINDPAYIKWLLDNNIDANRGGELAGAMNILVRANAPQESPVVDRNKSRVSAIHF